MTRRCALLTLIVVLAVVTSGCRREDNSKPDIEYQDRIIATARSTDDPASLLIAWFPAPCEAFDTVEVELDDDYANLRVRVTVDINDCPPPRRAETLVDLGEPLGDREVWDRTVNNTVALEV